MVLLSITPRSKNLKGLEMVNDLSHGSFKTREGYNTPEWAMGNNPAFALLGVNTVNSNRLFLALMSRIKKGWFRMSLRGTQPGTSGTDTVELCEALDLNPDANIGPLLYYHRPKQTPRSGHVFLLSNILRFWVCSNETEVNVHWWTWREHSLEIQWNKTALYSISAYPLPTARHSPKMPVWNVTIRKNSCASHKRYKASHWSYYMSVR